MTHEQFRNKKPLFGIEVTYKGECAIVQGVDYGEDLLGILLKDNEERDEFEITWVRCENCEFVD